MFTFLFFGIGNIFSQGSVSLNKNIDFIVASDSSLFNTTTAEENSNEIATVPRQEMLIPTYFQDEIKIFPGKKQVEEVWIFSITGQLIQNQQFNKTNSSEISFNSTKLPNGVYLCKVKLENSIITKKLIKQ